MAQQAEPTEAPFHGNGAVTNSGTPDEKAALRLAEILCARLCHDLSGPLGTVAMALEMATEHLEAAGPETQDVTETLGMAGEGARTLSNRLRLLRASWGGDGDPMDRARLAGLARGLPGRVTVDLSGLECVEPLPPAVARLALNLLMLAAEALPAGGRATLSGSLSQGLVLVIDGAHAAWPAGLEVSIARPGAIDLSALGPQGVQAPLTVLLASSVGLRLSMPAAAGPSGTTHRLVVSPAG